MPDETTQHTDNSETFFSAERAKAFVDAVVAIAMTLLILPLMESVSESAGAGADASEWFGAHWPQVQSFVLSFAIIALFWINHHRLFTKVEQVTRVLLWISMLWLLSIVWLPVATAMSGQMDGQLVKVFYIGSMIATCLITLGLRMYLRAHPSLHRIDDAQLRRGAAADIAMALLFSVALILALVIPVLSYYPLFLMFLVGPLQSQLARLLGAPNPAKLKAADR